MVLLLQSLEKGNSISREKERKVYKKLTYSSGLSKSKSVWVRNLLEGYWDNSFIEFNELLNNQILVGEEWGQLWLFDGPGFKFPEEECLIVSAWIRCLSLDQSTLGEGKRIK